MPEFLRKPLQNVSLANHMVASAILVVIEVLGTLLITPAAAAGPQLMCAGATSLRQQCQAMPCSSMSCGTGSVCVDNFCGQPKSCCVPVKRDCLCGDDNAFGDKAKPVCGDDMRTYASACEAACAGVRVRYKGRCAPSKSCTCRLNYWPVCGSDGKSYINSCVAQVCAGARIVDPVTCGLPRRTCAAGCIMLVAPVCGRDCNTYTNACEASCNYMALKHLGRCKKACKPPVIQPGGQVCAKCQSGGAGQAVCGRDGRTWASSCAAEQCGNTTVRHEGACTCDITVPAASCKGLGEDCTLAQTGQCPCCDGLICWDGPVSRLGEVLGSCRNASGPLPIG